MSSHHCHFLPPLYVKMSRRIDVMSWHRCKSTPLHQYHLCQHVSTHYCMSCHHCHVFDASLSRLWRIILCLDLIVMTWRHCASRHDCASTTHRDYIVRLDIMIVTMCRRIIVCFDMTSTNDITPKTYDHTSRHPDASRHPDIHWRV